MMNTFYGCFVSVLWQCCASAMSLELLEVEAVTRMGLLVFACSVKV